MARPNRSILPPLHRLMPAALMLTFAASAHAGRYEEFTTKFAHTPDQAKVLAASYFGTAGTEWLSGGGFQPDGTIVVTGTTLGPTFDTPVKALVLGRDGPAPAAPQPEVTKGRGGVERPGPLSWKHPNATGFIVRYAADLSSIKSVTRLPWGSGAITSTVVDKDGNIYIAGGAGPASEALASTTTDAKELPVQDAGAKKFATNAVYIAKLSADAGKVLWLRTMKGPSTCPRLDLSKKGSIVLQGPDIRTFSPAGALEATTVVPGGLEGNVAVNPVDGTYARGGEHHSPTGREPWRCPTLNIFKPDGKLLYQLYDWGGPYVGMDNNRLVSDSAVRGVTYDAEGNLIIHAWSDGGNSVMQFEPNDIRHAHGAFDRSMGMSIWGAGVLSAAYIIKIDTKTYHVTNGTLWMAYLPEKNKPNSIWIDAMDFATDGSVALAGRCAGALIRTGNHLGSPEPASDTYVALISPGLNSLRFSTDLPACGAAHVTGDDPIAFAKGTVNGKPRLLYLTAAREKDGQDKAAPTTANAPQKKFAGGLTDGYLLLLDLDTPAK